MFKRIYFVVIVIIVTSFIFLNNFISATSTEISNKKLSEPSVKSGQTGEGNKRAQYISSLSQKDSDCITVEEFKNMEEVRQGEAFIKENLLIANVVGQSLTSMGEDELILESKSGNSEAMFVLGMNYKWFSHRTSFNNPSLSLENFDATDKELDTSILKKARFWLWKAAINGVLISIPELANTYKLESDLGKNFNEKLQIQYVLYKALYYKVSPDIAKYEESSVEKQLNTLDNFDHEKVMALFDGLFEEWRSSRIEIGLGEYIDLYSPTLVENYKNENICVISN